MHEMSLYVSEYQTNRKASVNRIKFRAIDFVVQNFAPQKLDVIGLMN